MDLAHVVHSLRTGFLVASLVSKAKTPWDALALHWVNSGFERTDLGQTDSIFGRELHGPMSYNLAQTFLQGRLDASKASSIDHTMLRANSLRQADIWARTYTKETTRELLDTNASVLSHFIPKWLDLGMSQGLLAQRAKKLYGLDLRSAIAYENYRATSPKGSLTSMFSKLLGQRGDIVGDVHSFAALNSGRQMLYSQAVAEGVLPVKAKKVWLCVHPDTVVLSDQGLALAKKPHSGPMVTLRTTSDSSSLTVTPEHQVLTQRGWVRADQVHKGDDLFYVAWGDSIRTPHIDGRPATAAEVFGSGLNLSSTEEVGTMSRGVNLHVQHESGESEVQIVTADRQLLDYLMPNSSQCSHEVEFMLPDEVRIALLSDRSLMEGFDAHLPTCVSGRDQFVSGPFDGFGLLAGSQDTSFALGPQSSSLTEDASNSGLGTATLLRDPPRGHPGLVQAHQVTGVEISSFRGHVYDLQTESGWFSANGAIVHNCAIDERVCKYCGPMDEVAVGVNAHFKTPSGKVMQPPLHPRCRCVTVIDKAFSRGMITRTARFSSDDDKLANLVSRAKGALLG